MRIARLRALTLIKPANMEVFVCVEMSIARLRALTHTCPVKGYSLLTWVEMSIARLRALTSKSPVYLTGLLCDFRNEYKYEEGSGSCWIFLNAKQKKFLCKSLIMGRCPKNITDIQLLGVRNASVLPCFLPHVVLVSDDLRMGEQRIVLNLHMGLRR